VLILSQSSQRHEQNAFFWPTSLSSNGEYLGG
jgi:hypothetical protein